MINRFRPRPLLRRGLLALPLAVLLAPAALAQCPAPANCTPGPATDPFAALFGRGITRVTLNTLNSQTPINDGGYHDYCPTGGATTLLAGVTYPLTVTTAPGGAEIVRVWADFDNNGIFNPTTELVLASTATGLHTGTLSVPAGAVLNAPLRLRVASDDVSSLIRTPCTSPEYSETEDYAITIQANTTPPTAAFTAGADTVTCSGLVRFTDQSGGAPTTWLWSFGDNFASTQQNPSHQYTAPGVYTVRLIVTNANGTDTLTRPNYIRYDTQVPVAASCAPQTVANCCGYGIDRVRFGTLDRSLGNATGYQDYTCGSRASVVGGNTYDLIVTPTGTLVQDTRAWLDLNNDGQFTANELVLTVLAQADSAVARVTIPLAAPLNTPLRLRVIADAVNQPTGPCVGPQRGQAIDFTVIVRANTLPPAAAFTVTPPTPCDSTKTFADRSQNAPTAWLWNFGDGTTSTQQNPTHTYSQSGAFTVSLVVTNTFGRDSLAQADIAVVTVPCRTYCVPTGLQTQSIWINRVRYAEINRSSGLDPSAYAVTYAPAAHLTLGQGDSLTVTTTVNQGMGPPTFTTTAWIDFNQNSVWEASERVMQQQGDPNNLTLAELVTVPTSALAGPTMMRILTTRNQQLANNPCPPNGFGGIEVEDYLIIIRGTQTAPTAAFFTVDSVNCNGLVQFEDRSSNLPTAWRWTFGDGSVVSTERNPLHQYPTAPATYTVKLLVTNDFGRDSVVRAAAVRVTGDPVPMAPTCRPQSTTPSFGLGIDSVRVRAVGRELTNSTPDDTEGYRDYTCAQRSVIYRGKPATLRVTSIQPMGARILAWIDYNNDGDFNPVTERVLNVTNGPGGVAQATFTVPATVPLGVPIRLRVGSDWTNLPALRPCGTTGPQAQPQFGQMEDYTLVARDTALAVGALRAPLALTLAPNPTVDGRVLVRLSGDVPGTAAGAALTLTVRSVLGQEVLRRVLVVRPGIAAEVDLSALPRGVYVVQTDGPAAALRGTIRLIRD